MAGLPLDAYLVSRFCSCGLLCLMSLKDARLGNNCLDLLLLPFFIWFALLGWLSQSLGELHILLTSNKQWIHPDSTRILQFLKTSAAEVQMRSWGLLLWFVFLMQINRFKPEFWEIQGIKQAYMILIAVEVSFLLQAIWTQCFLSSHVQKGTSCIVYNQNSCTWKFQAIFSVTLHLPDAFCK